MTEERRYAPNLWLDFKDELGEMEIVSVSLDHARQLYVLAVSEADYRIVHPGGAGSPRLQTKKPHDFKVILGGENYTASYSITGEYWNYHRVQPLTNDELLLVCSRAFQYSSGEYERNARVFSLDGQFCREFSLGDGVADVQTTKAGHIWTSYFDEGISENIGWKHPGDPGLVEWDDSGHWLYSYSPRYELNYLADCYALNVENDRDVWLYYHTDFPLVHLRNGQIADYWHSPVRGSPAFAIWGEYALFCGDYEDKTAFTLLRLLKNHQMEQVAIYRFMDEFDRVIARGSQVILLKETACYSVDIWELLP